MCNLRHILHRENERVGGGGSGGERNGIYIATCIVLPNRFKDKYQKGKKIMLHFSKILLVKFVVHALSSTKSLLKCRELHCETIIAVHGKTYSAKNN